MSSPASTRGRRPRCATPAVAPIACCIEAGPGTTTHADFTDLPFLQATTAAEMEARARMLGTVRLVTRAFFDKTLKGLEGLECFEELEGFQGFERSARLAGRRPREDAFRRASTAVRARQASQAVIHRRAVAVRRFKAIASSTSTPTARYARAMLTRSQGAHNARKSRGGAVMLHVMS